MSHTPGPWTYEWVQFQEPPGEPWAVFGAEHDGFLADGRPTSVVDPVADVANEADARLIAAAPELLALAEQVRFSAELNEPASPSIESDMRYLGERARTAIVKAKGE